MLSNLARLLTAPPAVCAVLELMVVEWKSASSVRKHLVPELLHRAGRSTMYSAEVRAQEPHLALCVTFLPVVMSSTTSVNLPLANFTEMSILSPACTANTLTELAGNSSYQASYWGVLLFAPPHMAKVPSCSTVWSVKPSRPTQFEVHWFLTPGQVILGSTNVLCTKVNFLAATAAYPD